MDIRALLALVFAVSSCSGWTPEQRNYIDTRELSRVVNMNYVQPVVAYPEFAQPELMLLTTTAQSSAVAGNHLAAIDDYQKAWNLITEMDGKRSSMLLPVIDQMIRSHVALDDLEMADQLQHSYQKIVTANYKKNDAVMRNTAFRMGCWNSMIGDWYEAMFDFEDVIKSFNRAQEQELGLNDARQLEQAEDLAYLASKRCVPGW